MRIGVCGSGTIATWVSDILSQMDNDKIVRYGVASIEYEAAKKFADQWGWKKAYQSYDEMMADDAIDLIYIALPNHLHLEMCLKALDYGKNVVVEKPFAVNFEQAKAMIEKAKEKDCFISEAYWMAFLPSRHIIDHIIKDGKIGEIVRAKMLGAGNVMFLDRVKHLETGGGSLLDMGPYTLGRMTCHLGLDIESVEGKFEMLDTGVDARDYYTVTYRNGVKVECTSMINATEQERQEWGEIYGTKGSIWFNSMSNPSEIEIRDLDGKVIERPALPPLIHAKTESFVSGYEHEWLGFEKALSEGKKMADDAPWEQTLKVAELMTELRRQAGIVFPFE